MGQENESLQALDEALLATARMGDWNAAMQIRDEHSSAEAWDRFSGCLYDIVARRLFPHALDVRELWRYVRPRDVVNAAVEARR